MPLFGAQANHMTPRMLAHARAINGSTGEKTDWSFVRFPRDPEVTTILSLTTHSLVVLHSRKKRAGEANCGPDVQSVHQFYQEINPALAEVKPVNGTLHVCLPKRRARHIPGVWYG